MRLADFILLSDEQKKLILLNEGILVGKRMNQDCIVFLFQLHLFYIETYCDLETKKVREYRAFGGTNQLTPYLEQISISHLLE